MPCSMMKLNEDAPTFSHTSFINCYIENGCFFFATLEISVKSKKERKKNPNRPSVRFHKITISSFTVCVVFIFHSLISMMLVMLLLLLLLQESAKSTKQWWQHPIFKYEFNIQFIYIHISCTYMNRVYSIKHPDHHHRIFTAFWCGAANVYFKRIKNYIKIANCSFALLAYHSLSWWIRINERAARMRNFIFLQ